MPVQNKDDVSFGFDPTFFNNGVNKILEKLGVLKKSTVNVAKQMTQGFMQMAKKVAVFVLSMKGIKGLFNQIPEIGKAFGIAKEIAFKNFLFPLRKTIYPLLQQMLTWVRDNRKTFIIWGQALANVFNIVISNLKNVMSFGKQLGNFFLNFINKIFGTQIRSFEELINLITFKIAVTLEYLKSLFPSLLKNLNPIIKGFGELGSNVLPIIIGLIGGFFEKVSGIEKYFGSILNSVNRILKGWTEIDSHGNKFNAVARSISGIFGTIVKFVTSIADSFIKGITPKIIALKQPIKDIAAAFDRLFNKPENAKKWKEIFEGIGKIAGTLLKDAFQALSDIIELIGKGIEKILEFFTSEGMKKFFEYVEAGYNFLTGKKIQEPERVGLSKQAIDNLIAAGEMAGPSEKSKTKLMQAKDIIITKKGDIVQTDPEDNIMAYKNKSQGGKSIIIEKIDFSNMKIYTAGISTEDAANFSNNIVSMITEQLNKELITAGI